MLNLKDALVTLTQVSRGTDDRLKCQILETICQIAATKRGWSAVSVLGVPRDHIKQLTAWIRGLGFTVAYAKDTSTLDISWLEPCWSAPASLTSSEFQVVPQRDPKA